MSGDLKVLAFCGSLRAGSYNRMARQAAESLAPPGMAFTDAEIGDLPLYNDDERLKATPPAVARLAEQVRAAGLLLFVSPEYNYSVPGTLKNAIDWLSRISPAPFAGKPACVMGASQGALGTARMQYHLRQIGVFLDLRFMNKPEVMIATAQERFDASGTLTHEPTREAIRKFMAAAKAWGEKPRA